MQHPHHTFDVERLTNRSMRSAVLWALFMSLFIVAAASLLARATRNMQAALVEKPDIAIYFLQKEENIGRTTLLRESEEGKRRQYLAETSEGKLLVDMRKGEEEWYVAETERLRE
jgi:hypothetical protein